MIANKLVGALLESSKGVDEYYKLNLDPELFKGPELALFELVHKHVQSYGVLPSRDTVNKNSGVDIPEGLPEPPAYYRDKMLARHVHLSVKDAIIQAGTLLNIKKAPFEALECIKNAALDIYLHKHKSRVVNYSSEGFEVITNEIRQKLLHGDEHGLCFGWPTLDKLSGGLAGGDVISFVGRPACVSGSMQLYVSRKGKGAGRYYTLEELYRGMAGSLARPGKGAKKWDLTIPTRIQSLMPDGMTGLNIVEEVISCGIKTTYTVTTDQQKSIRATGEHRFCTEHGYVPLKDLQVGDRIVCKAPKGRRRSTKARRSYRKEITGFFPYSQYASRTADGVETHYVQEYRAAYDAKVNAVALDKFLIEIATNPDNGYVFSDRSEQVQHVDGDMRNNAPENLVVLSNAEHAQIHVEDTRAPARVKLSRVHTEAIVSIEYFGDEATYDLVCADPHNNFVANGFVTHNSGKTYNMIYGALHTWKTGKTPLFVSMEMKPLPIIQRVAAIDTTTAITEIRQGTMSTAKGKAMQGKLQANKDKHPFWIIDGSLASKMGDLVMYATQFSPDVVFIDGAYLIQADNPKMPRWERVTSNAERIKSDIAEALNIPVVISYQFNRDSVKGKNDPALHNIAYTDAIGQLSSLVLGLLEEDTVETLVRRRVSILKGRNGEIGEFFIRWIFDAPGPDYMDFSEIVEEDYSQLEYI